MIMQDKFAYEDDIVRDAAREFISRLGKKCCRGLKGGLLPVAMKTSLISGNLRCVHRRWVGRHLGTWAFGRGRNACGSILSRLTNYFLFTHRKAPLLGETV